MWGDLSALPARRSSAEVTQLGEQKQHAPTHPRSSKGSYFPSSPKHSAKVSRQTDSPRSSLAARPSPGATWAALQEKDLSLQEAPRSSHRREPAGAFVAPANGQPAHHAKTNPKTSPQAHVPHHPVTEESTRPQFASLWPAQQAWLSSSTAEQPSLQTSQVAHAPRATPQERRPSRQEAAHDASTEQLARQTSSPKHARESWAGQIGTGPTPQLGGRKRAHAAKPRLLPHKAKKKVYCGQNRLDPSLIENGGTLEVGARSSCFRSGYGGALYQHIRDEDAFIRKFSVPYAPLVVQKLWYKDSPPPAGYQPATLSQARTRGWGAGSAALARKLREKRKGQGR